MSFLETPADPITAISGADLGNIGSQSTTSNTYTDLSTPGPAVTIMTGTDAIAFVSCQSSRNGTGQFSYVSVAVSGASSVSATDDNAGIHSGFGVSTVQYQGTGSRVVKFTGLTPGINTFTMKYRTDGTSFGFFFRGITVMAV